MKEPGRLAEGRIFHDRYVVAGKVADGGMSRVYLAHDLRLPGKRWAIKESVIREPEAAVTLETEAKMLLTLEHHRLPRVADFYAPDHDGYCYMVMDYIEGITLAEWVSVHGADGIKGEKLLHLAVQLLEVLQYLHERRPAVIYRDLKPSNIMITPAGDAVLIDFGIARSRSGEGTDTMQLGTVGFAAPEQYRGVSDARSDLYSLGALLVYAATGGECTVWQPALARRLRGRMPGALLTLLGRLLRPEPEQRCPSAAAALAALAAQAPPAAAPAPAPRAAAASRGGPLAVGVLGTAHGAGTTHTSLALAACLAAAGASNRVTWFDCVPGAPAYARLRVLAGADEAAPAGPAPPGFRWRGIAFAALQAGAADMMATPQPGCAYAVYDLGGEPEPAALELLRRCDVPLLVAPGAPWRLEELPRWLRRAGLAPEPHWRVALPLAAGEAAAVLSGLLDGAVVAPLPAQADPFQSGRLHAALRELVPPHSTAGKCRAAKTKPGVTGAEGRWTKFRGLLPRR